MRPVDKTFLLALICVLTAPGGCLFAREASAGDDPALAGANEIRFESFVKAASTDEPAASPSARPDFTAATPRARSGQAGAPFQPELPPDDGNAPPSLPNQPSHAPPAAVVAAAPAGAALSAGASPADIEAAVETMLTEKARGKPVGARDWRAARMAIGVFYLERGFAPVWTGQGGTTPAARTTIARLERAGEDGLDLSALSIPAAAASAPTPAQLAEADVQISEAVVAYAIQASGGRIAPGSISQEITDKPNVADSFDALKRVADANDPGVILEDFNPPQKGYRDLRDKLAELRAEDRPAAVRFPAGPALGIGMVDPRVAIIRARFGLDAIADDGGSGALVYDARVAAAVADFQRANGLPASGRLTPDTADALSRGASSRREAAILANMEMWRWEPRDMGEERVEVNVPDFTLKVTQGDQIVHRARVIVGKPDTQTAIFSNQIKYLLINPAWNVPMSIIKKEMLPKLVNDPDYLTRAGFEVTQKGDTLVVRQPPGERNALGHILFMFPNQHSIYLHDTPSRGLFSAARRAFSHGCVRVDDPMRLGELVMGGADRGWSQQRLRSLVGDKERTIFLPRPLAIHLEYFTAFVDDSGVLQLREDIYGHTGRVEAALGLLTPG